MEKIKKELIERIPAILFITFMLASVMIFMLIISSNKYEDDIAQLKLANKKLEIDNHDLTHTVETLKSEKDAECNCGWYEDFYYDHAEEFGAYE